MIALAVGQAEQPLLEDRILAVPQRQREAEPLPIVGDAGNAVLAPAVGARARLVVREVEPGIAVLAVILANGSPLPLTQVRTPHPPGHARARLAEPVFLSCQLLAAHGSSPSDDLPRSHITRGG